MNEEQSALRDDDLDPQGVSLTAADVQQQKFLIKFRGYDTQDVDAFHDVVAREMERQQNENTRLYDELQLLHREIELYRKKEESLNTALMNVQKTVDGLKQRAASESDRMLSHARSEAARMAAEAQNKANDLYGQAQTLKVAAQKEAKMLLDHARREAAGIRDALKAEREHASGEITALNQRKIQFQSELKALLAAHFRLIDNYDDPS